MPTIPDVAQLGARPTPQPQRGVYSASVGQEAQALSERAGVIGKVGDVVNQYATKENDDQDKLDLANAETNFLTQQISFEKSLKTDPNYQTFNQRYTENMNAAKANAVGMIKNPSLAAQFGAKLDQNIVNGSGRIDDLKLARWKDTAQASFYQQGDTLRQALNGSGDFSHHQKAIAAYNLSADSYAAQGAISREEAAKSKEKFAAQLQEDYVVHGIGNDPAGMLKVLSDGKSGSSTGSNAYNLGNVKTASGAVNGTADFVAPATPTDGAILAANNLRKNYQGLTVAQIGAKWAPSSENKTSDWVVNVSKASGLSPDAVPNLDDPQQLTSLLKGIATAEKSPSDRANFSDAVIADGVQGALSGKQPQTAAAQQQNNANDPFPNLTVEKRDILTRAAQVAVDRQTKQAEAEQKKQQESTMNNWIERAQPGAQNPLTVTEIVQDRNLTPQQHETMLTMLHTTTQRTEETNPSVFNDLFAKIHAAPESPDRIYSTDQLIPYLGKGIKIEDLDRLRSEITKQSEPDKEARNQALETLRLQVTNEVGGLFGAKDPIGEENWLRALPMVTQAEADAKKRGISVAEMYNPDSKEYVGNSVRQFLRSDADKKADQIIQSEVTRLGDQGKDALTEYYRKSMFEKNGKAISLAGKELIKRGYYAPPAAPSTAPQVPMSR